MKIIEEPKLRALSPLNLGEGLGWLSQVRSSPMDQLGMVSLVPGWDISKELEGRGGGTG